MPENPTPDPTQLSLIQRAIQGDAQAVQNVLQYLNAASPDLRHIIQAQLHQTGDTRIWQHLLYCLGHGCWQIDETPSPNLPHSETSQRGFQTIVEVFVIDENEQEAADKMQVLRSALSDPDADLRIAAAYLLGLRGEIDALSLLEAMLQSPGLEWQLRAAQALAALNDERCGAPLVAALSAGRGTPLHHAAGKALSELGICAEPALLQSLHHPDNHVRWHAARLLGQIGDPRAVDVLVTGLWDEDQQVRWATARVLANLDMPAVPAILEALSHQPLTEEFRQAAFHALHSMTNQATQEYLQPLLRVLGSPATRSAASPIAQQLLAGWSSHVPQREERNLQNLFA